ncbi:MAG: sugar-binding protein [Eubacteriales bacterium]
MKRALAILLVVSTVIFCAMTVSAAGNTFNAAKGTATIDAVMDDVYTAADQINVAFTTTDSKATAKLWVVYDATALYAYADVTDPTPAKVGNATDFWNGDSFELDIDLVHDGSDTAIADIDAGQFTALPYPEGNNEIRGGGKLQGEIKDTSSYVFKRTDTGYIVEYKLVFGAVKPAAGAKLGIAAQINDDTNDDVLRESLVNISEGQDMAWSTSGSYDTLVLSDKEYVAPTEAPADAPAEDKPTAPATGDTTIVLAVLATLATAGAVVLKKRTSK